MPYLRSRAAWLALLVVGAAPLATPSGVLAGESDHPKFEVGIGWSFLHINDIEFTAVTDFFVTEVIDHQTDHDGELNGYKLTAGLTGLMAHRRGDWLASVGVKGFYSRYEDEEDGRCTFTAGTDCVFIPIVDPDPGIIDSSGGLFSDWFTSTDRSVTYWGAAVELSLTRYSAGGGLKDGGGSLKDAPAPVAEPSPFTWKVGLGARRLDQQTDLFSEDLGPTLDPVTLSDDLDTTYYGAYVGFTTVKPIGGDFRLRLSGETGLYYADTEYFGAYTGSASLGTDQPVAESIALDDSRAAFIGTLNLSLEREVGWATVALFGEAEWLSYAPKVLYNDVDRAGGFPFDVNGTQDGTELGGGSALTYTLGARVSVPLR
jgi:hypothetical protein